jgi:DNA (cytosine-5)-methyltransferase 1
MSVMNSEKYKFIDLFAGIGGFHLALSDLGAECVFAAEIDRHARKTYEENFKRHNEELFAGVNFASDISDVDPAQVPEFDILCAGFPCQPFSQAGYKKGFQDSNNNRGNMFFEIVRFLKTKRPPAFFLENVRHLKNHDDGRTFETIKNTLEELGYSFYFNIVKASDFGLPQHRPRIFMVGFLDDSEKSFEFAQPQPLEMFMSDVFGEPCNKSIGYTLRVGGRGSGLNDRRNWDTYMVNGRQLRLNSEAGKKMQGFPANFRFPVSETQAMKQLGNSVAVTAVRATAKQIIGYLNDRQQQK